MSDALIEALEPLIERVRTDVTAVKSNGRQAWTTEPLTQARLAKHLNGGPARGVCPIKAGESTTMVGLLDLDSHKGEIPWDGMVAAADQVLGALLMDGMVATPWRSSGGNGIHLIVLWDEPQDAYSVRCALTEALETCGYSNGAGGLVKRQIEVFPKQDSVPVGGYGNQFVLPLAGASEPLIPALGYEPGGRDAAVGMHWPVSVPVARRERPARAVGEAGGSGDTPRLRAALAAIPNEGEHELDYDEWRNVVFGIHHATGGAGLDLAHEFSARSSKYDPAFLDERVWPYVTAGKGVTEATIFAKAREAGWVEDIDAEFDVVVVEPAAPGEAVPLADPVFDREKSGVIKPTMTNTVLACARADLLGMRVAYDQFRDEITVSRPGVDEWRPMTDADQVDARIALETLNFKSAPKEMVRDACVLVAARNHYDSATLWLNSLRWDGVERVESFLTRFMGAEDSPYARAVSMYMWTALAGRVLVPGVKADMAPIYEGDQGLRKSTAIAAIAPAPEFFVEVDFETKEEDRARMLRGALVGEIAELSGLHTKAIENIKKFMTRTHEKWVPKYREFSTTFARRCLFIGTTNRDDILADETGNRRWLPVHVTRADVEGIVRERDQLWAEGAARFIAGGVSWQQAEVLAPVQHDQYRREDAWETAIQRWLEMDADLEHGAVPNGAVRFTTSDVLAGALGMQTAQHDRLAQNRVSAVLRTFGYEQKTARIGGLPMRAWLKRL